VRGSIGWTRSFCFFLEQCQKEGIVKAITTIYSKQVLKPGKMY
jgi:hypothetical protein